MSDDIETVRLLLSSNAKVNSEDNFHNTPLIYAVLEKPLSLQILTMLIESGADVNAKDSIGYTALMWVSLNGDAEAARLLIAHGADVNYITSGRLGGRSALRLAKQERHENVVQILSKAGAREYWVAPSAQNAVPVPGGAGENGLHPARELQSAIGDLGIQSGLIALTRGELEVLREKGDRHYYEVTLLRGAQPQSVATVGLQLKEADPRHGKFTINVSADGRTIEKKDRAVDEPIQFYSGRDHLLYELVVWAVDKNKATGYLSTPKNAPVPVTAN